MVLQLLGVMTLLVLSPLTVLGNFWFTYGIWPVSWAAFFAFFVVQTLLYAALGLARTVASA